MNNLESVVLELEELLDAAEEHNEELYDELDAIKNLLLVTLVELNKYKSERIRELEDDQCCCHEFDDEFYH